MPDQIIIRPPLVARVAVVSFGVFWVGEVLGTGLFGGGDFAGSLAGSVVMAAFGAVVCWRSATLAIRTDGAELVVRNALRTYRLRRTDIADIRAGRLTWPQWGRTILVLMRDGTVITPEASRGMFGKRPDEQQVEQLRRWLAQAG